ncbi:hypothetical protein [Brucella intermedia]|uniref:hypothetical protein n=1 Tax=Brucella intermedia TaxID=94625 RepID=UPI002361FBD2|nr:hypothetical protein [Brucella intermedia]
MTEDAIPDYIEPMNDESYWSRIQLQFDSLSSLFDMRLETMAEAVGHEEEPTGGKRRWVSDAPRWNGRRAWLLLPYIDALDQARLREQIEIGRELIQSIHERLQKRELSSSFLHDWGRFRAAAGLIEFIYFSDTSTGHRRSAIAGGKAKIDDVEAHQRWFAHYFLRNYKRGQRKGAEKSVERLVNAIIDGKVAVPAGWDVKWFENYLVLDNPKSPAYETLKPAFDEHSLSVTAMRKLVAMGAEGIPPIDLEFPDP